MNFDLTDDQVALRDGIRSLLEGRFSMERIREGFDRSMFDELSEAGVSHLGLMVSPGRILLSYTRRLGVLAFPAH